jgi:hypothetical protein
MMSHFLRLRFFIAVGALSFGILPTSSSTAFPPPGTYYVSSLRGSITVRKLYRQMRADPSCHSGPARPVIFPLQQRAGSIRRFEGSIGSTLSLTFLPGEEPEIRLVFFTYDTRDSYIVFDVTAERGVRAGNLAGTYTAGFVPLTVTGVTRYEDGDAVRSEPFLPQGTGWSVTSTQAAQS